MGVLKEKWYSSRERDGVKGVPTPWPLPERRGRNRDRHLREHRNR